MHLQHWGKINSTAVFNKEEDLLKSVHGDFVSPSFSFFFFFFSFGLMRFIFPTGSCSRLSGGVPNVNLRKVKPVFIFFLGFSFVLERYAMVFILFARHVHSFLKTGVKILFPLRCFQNQFYVSTRERVYTGQTLTRK